MVPYNKPTSGLHAIQNVPYNGPLIKKPPVQPSGQDRSTGQAWQRMQQDNQNLRRDVRDVERDVRELRQSLLNMQRDHKDAFDILQNALTASRRGGRSDRDLSINELADILGGKGGGRSQSRVDVKDVIDALQANSRRGRGGNRSGGGIADLIDALQGNSRRGRGSDAGDLRDPLHGHARRGQRQNSNDMFRNFNDSDAGEISGSSSSSLFGNRPDRRDNSRHGGGNRDPFPRIR